MDYVRQILLNVETLDKPNFEDLLLNKTDEYEREKLYDHLRMLIHEAALLGGIPANTMSERSWIKMRLTWRGHEYLENIRDPEIWAKTKQGAQKVGSFSLEVIGALAKGFIKQQVKSTQALK